MSQSKPKGLYFESNNEVYYWYEGWRKTSSNPISEVGFFREGPYENETGTPLQFILPAEWMESVAFP